MHLICWAYKEIKLLFYIFSKRHFDSSKWNKKKQKTDPQSSTVLLNVWLFVGAPVRVYLHGLVRRLLYSHLTPSTLSSPSLPPSSVLQCTSILTLRLLLPHRSMGEHAWCYDRCMSAAFALRKTSGWVSLLSASSGLWGLATQRWKPFRKTTTPAEEVSAEAGRTQCINTLVSRLNLCGFGWFILIFFFYTLLIWKTLLHKHSRKHMSYRRILRHYFFLTGFMWSNHLTNLDWDGAFLVLSFSVAANHFILLLGMDIRCDEYWKQYV